MISVNLHAKELSGGSQVAKFEVRRQLLNDGVNLCCVFASKSDVINKDWHKNAHTILVVNAHTIIVVNVDTMV